MTDIDALIEMVWNKCIPEPNSGCWLWTGAVYREQRNHQYGTFSVKNKRTSVHRAVYEAASGKSIPRGMVVRHTCDVCLCVNPSHLVLGTQAENVRDMWERGRAHHIKAPEINKAAAKAANDTMRTNPKLRARGQRHGMYGISLAGELNGFAKLTEKEVAQIRDLAGLMTQRAIAARFGVTQGVIWRIIHNRSWIINPALRAIKAKETP